MEIRSYEGLQDLQAMLDLLSKGCNTNYTNLPAIRLYECIGFQKANRLLTYKKAMEVNDEYK